MARRFFLALTTLALLSSCSGPQSTRKLSYGATAKQAYLSGLIELRDENCLDAEPIFTDIRRNYPYSRYSALSEVRIADCRFMNEQYGSAISSYRQFVRFRPAHPMVEYSRFRIADAYFAQIPDDWFLAPPSHERDQQPAHDALRQLRRFVVDYPDSRYREHADRMTKRVLRLLADHELYVGHFYWRRDAYPAVVARMQTLLSAYAGSGAEAEALVLKAQAHIELKEFTEAKRALEEVVSDFSDSEYVDEAKSMLKEKQIAEAFDPKSQPQNKVSNNAKSES